MSPLATADLPIFAPPAANGLSVVCTGTNWTLGAYTPFVATTGAAAQISAYAQFQAADPREYELVIAIGAAGSEVGLSTIRGCFTDGNAGSPQCYDLLAPENGVPTGSRIAFGIRVGNVIVPEGSEMSLTYYEGLSSDNQTDIPIASLPAAADGAALTTSATPWANSNIGEISNGINLTFSVIGITMTKPTDNFTYELDLLEGAAGSETVFTTIKGPVAVLGGAGLSPSANLTAPYPLATGTRIASQLRKSGTEVDIFRVGLNVYLESVIPPVPAGTEFTVRCERVFLLPTSPSYKRMFLGRLEFLIQQGVGYGAGQGVDPQVMVSISRDGGHSFGPEFLLSVGKVGEYLHRSYRNAPNGYYRNGAIKIATSDPNFVAWLSASADISEGLS